LRQHGGCDLQNGSQPFVTFGAAGHTLQRKDISMEDYFEHPCYPGELGDRKNYNRLVFICSPYRPQSDDPAEQARELLRNIKLAKIGCRLAVEHGCAPIAPHLLYPQFLDDRDPEERDAGKKCGLQFLNICDEMWVLGRKITQGMAAEIAAANANGIPIFVLEHPENTEERILKELFKDRYKSEADRLYQETAGKKHE